MTTERRDIPAAGPAGLLVLLVFPRSTLPAFAIWPLLIAALLSSACATAQEQVLVIRNVTVIDATGAAPSPDMTVVVRESRIAAIGRSDKMRIPVGAQVVDGSGKFLIPGLRDMHLHLGDYDSGKRALQRLLASGITGVRDMASPIDEILRLRAETSDPGSDLPRLVVAGPILQGPLPFDLQMVRPVVGEEEGRSAVNDLKAEGVDFIKTGDTVSREVYFAVADESRKLDIPFVGHVPTSVSASEASRAGQRSIEHFGSARFHAVLIACSTEELELSHIVQEALAAAMAGGESPDATLFSAGFTRRLVNTYSSARAASLFDTFAQNRTWQVPTLVALHEVWISMRSELAQEDIQAGDELWGKYREMIRDMRSAGVEFLAGTDLPIGEETAALHEELELLVEAGMTPMEALQTATRNPAQFLGISDREGTVEVDKVADLLLLEANPLDDIANTRRIEAVVLGGRLIPERLRP